MLEAFFNSESSGDTLELLLGKLAWLRVVEVVQLELQVISLANFACLLQTTALQLHAVMRLVDEGQVAVVIKVVVVLQEDHVLATSSLNRVELCYGL